MLINPNHITVLVRKASWIIKLIGSVDELQINPNRSLMFIAKVIILIFLKQDKCSLHS